jgi:hypothetical protein
MAVDGAEDVIAPESGENSITESFWLVSCTVDQILLGRKNHWGRDGHVARMGEMRNVCKML